MPNLQIADLHSHYPMHLAAVDRGDPANATRLQQVLDDAQDLGERVLFAAARAFLNDPSAGAGPAVSLERYRQGRVALACSVLYSPFDELNVDGFRRQPPTAQAFDSVLSQMAAVETEVNAVASVGEIARNRADLQRIAAVQKVALVHCIEGGFQLGASEAELSRNIPLLRQRGVLYVTLAHLLYRQVATCAPAFPFLPDLFFHIAHPQPNTGLTVLGRCAAHLLSQNRVLIDVTHMSEPSLIETFALLDQRDPARTLPVIASHMACRFGHLEYNMPDRFLRSIAARNGVIGVIVCEHYASDGLGPKPRSFAESFAIVCRHIDHIHTVTGSYDHIAIGSDHDGFIKPTLPGLEDPRTLARLADALEVHYGSAVAGKICSTNVRRVIDAVWP
jgi:microsomal dipeptidase-like Zn-dependent dipeptidase